VAAGQGVQLVDRRPGQTRDDDPARAGRQRDDVRDGDDRHAGRFGGGDAGRAVLDRQALGGRHAEPGGRRQVGLRVRLAVPHLVTGDDGAECARRQMASHGRREPGVGHRHEGTGDAGVRQLAEQLGHPGSPRYVLVHRGDHPVEQQLDDLRRRQVDVAVQADVLR
jgi:hypothetical protein